MAGLIIIIFFFPSTDKRKCLSNVINTNVVIFLSFSFSLSLLRSFFLPRRLHCSTKLSHLISRLSRQHQNDLSSFFIGIYLHFDYTLTVSLFFVWYLSIFNSGRNSRSSAVIVSDRSAVVPTRLLMSCLLALLIIPNGHGIFCLTSHWPHFSASSLIDSH